MNRRQWLLNSALLSAFGWRGVAAGKTTEGADDFQRHWQGFLPAKHELSLDLTPLQRSKAE